MTTTTAPRTLPTRPRHATAAVALAAGLLAVVVVSLLSLAVGARPIAIDVVLQAVWSPDGSADHAVVRDGRLPRTLLGLLAGAALGVAGALMQAVTRNPLAEPGLLGVNAGAAFAVVVAVGFGATSIRGHVWVAFAGAVAAAVIVHLVGGARRPDPVRLTLAGVAFAAVLTGAGHGLSLLDAQAYARLRAWQLGSLDVRSMDPVVVIVPFVVVGLLIALASTRGLNALGLGDDLALAVGASLWRTRALALAAITLLAGSATAAAGSIGFVGLMVPHGVRRVAGPDQRWVIPLSAVWAPVLLLAGDVVGRVLTSAEVPVGVVTAFLGAPVLLAIATRARIRGL